MKKVFLVVVLIILSLSVVSAAKYDRADGFGLGLSGGYPVSGLALKYGMGGDFRFVGTFGYSVRDNGAIEFGVQYDLDNSSIGRSPIYLNIGFTAAMNFGPEIDVFSVNVPIGFSYYLRNAPPMELFFKLTPPGIRVYSNSIEPDLGGAIGFLYYLNR